MSSLAHPPGALPIDTAGMPVSADPVENGVQIVNLSVPRGEHGHTVWRDLSASEKEERRRYCARETDLEAQRLANAVRAKRHGLLRATMHLVAADEPDRELWLAYREQLRAVPDSIDDSAAWPEPPGELPPADVPW